MTDLTYNIVAPLESDSEGDREVFMVGQGSVPTNQAEQEITQTTIVEIARSESLARTRSRVTLVGPEHPGSMTRRGSTTALSPMYSGHAAIGPSTSLSHNIIYTHHTGAFQWFGPHVLT
jgi:hypothetical protein